VAATGTAPLGYQWSKNAAVISGATSSSYTTPATTGSDNGAQFTVVVNNAAGSATSNAAGLTVNPAPVAPSINAQPASQTVIAGQTASFSVAATGTAPLSYQWSKNATLISGATSSSYTTPVTTSSDNGALFTVVASNTAGSVTSSAATLTVNAAPVAPSITTQPASQTVTAGQTASFSVATTGTAPISYQWRKNSAAISGATLSSYSTPATTGSDNGAQFTVVVNNTAGSVTSNAAGLTVNPAPVAPSITTQPASQTVTAGQTASFSVAVTGTAPLSYQWSKNTTAISGATSSSYTTPATSVSDNGALFTVVVSNAAGSVTSNPATLTVSAAPVAPSITTQPASQTVTAGQTASFSVAATGTAPLGYQWSKNAAVISGATSSSYTTPATTGSDNGAQFTVVVSNTAGSVTSSAAALTVNPAPVAPSITTQPASQTVTAGQTASFSVAARGTAPLGYQWSKNATVISGATSSSYTTPATTSSDNGAQFTVVVTNTAGSVTSNAAALTVNPAPVAPSITNQPTSQTVTAGQTASFSVAATGTAPLSYQWQKNSAAISGATSSSYSTPATTSSDNGALFTVVVSNTVGSVTSSAAALTVNPAAVAPSITTQPANQTVTAGQTASFSVAATGTAPLSYQWSKNATVISGATSSSYTTPATTNSDNGALFTVVVSNTAGSVTSSAATLTVNPAPVAPSITTQPASQTVTAGQTASFSVAATGTTPLSYQWQKNNVAISGATSSSYTTPVTTSSDNGALFTVTVSNTAGSVTSNAATLTVNAGGTIINVLNYGATGNGSTNDTAAIDNAIAALQPGYELFFPCGTYQISAGLAAIAKNNVAIAGQTGCGAVTIRSSGGGSTILQIGSGQNLTSPTPITATTADLDQTFQANFSAIGAGVGDYVFLSETVSTADTTHTNCGGSGCRGEVLRITGLSGNTATVETAVHHAYDPSCCVPWVQKLLNPVSGVSVHDLVLDGSGAAMYALAVLNAVNLNVNNLTLQNISCSAIAAVNGYNDAYSTITITHAGTNNGCSIGGSAVSLQQQGNLNVNGVSLSNLNVGAFGFIPFREANGTFSNISVDGTGTGSGRLFKTNSAAHNVFNNISTNRDEGAYYQGITIEYFSHHNVWNNCKVTNNVGSPNNSGITLYGDLANGNHQGGNHYNTFNNCTVTGNSGFALWVNDNNNYLEINGGTYSGVPGQYVLAFDDSAPCCTNNAYIHNATIGGPGSIGIFIENGSKNACINNNTFVLGLTTGINVTDASDVGTGNILNGLSTNLLAGTCGPSVPVSISPTAATVASGGTQQFTATVTGSTNTAVTWTATAGSVSSSGLFTAPIVGANTTVTVTATSQANPAQSASATVTVTAPPPPNTFGYAVQGTLIGATMSNNISATRYQMAGQNATVTSMSVFIASPLSPVPNNQFQVAIYADSNGAPGALLASSISQTIVPNAWNAVSITVPVSANTYYWLAYNTNGLAGNVNNLRYDTSGASTTWTGSTAFGTWPTPFAPIGGSASNRQSMYATFQ